MGHIKIKDCEPGELIKIIKNYDGRQPSVDSQLSCGCGIYTTEDRLNLESKPHFIVMALNDIMICKKCDKNIKYYEPDEIELAHAGRVP